MATIQDVAKKANVSVATVSRVINNSPLVSADACNKVIGAIAQLNYSPNMLGRNLRKTQTHMILVLLPSIANPFYSTIVKGIEDAANESGYSIMLCNTDSDLKRESVYIELLMQKLADAAIFMATELDQKSLGALAGAYPVIQCCEYKEGAKAAHVSINNFNAAYDATAHLIRSGHKRIGYITCDNDFLSTAQRLSGFKSALSDSNIIVNESLIVSGDYSFQSGYLAAKALLSAKEKPTAVFAISDVMAIGAIRAFIDSGLSVPHDISVMGFDDISVSAMYSPSLSTIAQPKYSLGKASAQYLLKMLGTSTVSYENIYLDHKLMIRESTRNI